MPAETDPRLIAAELAPRVRPVDLASPRLIHVIGVGGAGMRAIARILVAMGHSVTGSDRAESEHLRALESVGVSVGVGHRPLVATAADFVTRSTAVPDDDPEVVAAVEAGVPVYSRAEVLAAIVAIRPGVLVAGTHGKTTTSSMLAVLLDHSGLDPSFVIGSDVDYFGTGARWGGSEHFVVEADESDGTFLALRGAHAIVTSLDPDHLEFYGSQQRLSAAFEAFVLGIEGVIAVCVDDPDTNVLLDHRGVVTYGTADGADLQIRELQTGRHRSSFSVRWMGEDLGPVEVALPGTHNALNAAGALAIGLSLGLDFAVAARGVARFSGVSRRFEARGAHAGVHFVDDYAHLPTEVEAAIATARQGGWNRIIAAYQPHRFSRTEALADQFAESFRDADHLVLTDIYPAGEAPRAGVTGRLVLDAVESACPELSISWQPSLDDVADHLANILGPGDLCLTLGAGNLTEMPDRVLNQLRRSYPMDLDWLRTLEPTLAATDIDFDARIGPLTTYRVGGSCRALAIVRSASDLERLVQGAAAARAPVIALGRGSNTLVADRGVQAIVVTLAGEFDDVSIEDTTVTLGAGVSLPAAARRLTKASLRGFEWAVGVPGTVGGAIAMNAGGHGSDMADSVVSATVLDVRTGRSETRSAADLAFGYRQSSIASHELVLDATLELERGDRAASEQELTAIVRWRREHQPGGQNAGSVFTNPDGDSAGRLIDAAGGKGLRIRTAQVSAKHANFIQADPDGRADDVHELMSRIIELVWDHAGVTLIPETRLLGFDRPAQ